MTGPHSRSILSHAVLMLILTTAACVHAASDAQFQPAQAAFAQALEGDEAALKRAVTAFEAMHQHEPTDPLFMAYLGASTALQATTTWLPWRKMRYAEDGLALLDKALSLLGSAHDKTLHDGVAASLQVRFLASNTFLALPGFMNRAARGAKLLADIQTSTAFATVPVGFAARVWLRAAQLAIADKRIAQARALLEQVVQAKTAQTPAALELLKGLDS